ncbi:MAG: arylesterase [Gammaproteobacteria bacterium]|jgi:acyl-CoA thioesterase-1
MRLCILSFFIFNSYSIELYGEEILIIGDSISAGYGVNLTEAWPSLLQAMLEDDHLVINSSVSGDTSAGGLFRANQYFSINKPDIVVIEIGGNDGLRGLSLGDLKNNIQAIIEQSLNFGANVILCGMQLPPNYGESFAAAFQNIYSDLALEFDITLIPEFLQEVALSSNMMQSDGIHPNRLGQQSLALKVYPYILGEVENG